MMTMTNITEMNNKIQTQWGIASLWPEWFTQLVNHTHMLGVRGTAQALGVSAALVSLTLNNKHRKSKRGGNLIEERVRTRLMVQRVECPIQGMILKSFCITKQQEPLTITNPFRVEQYRACRKCPHCEHKKEKKQ